MIQLPTSRSAEILASHPVLLLSSRSGVQSNVMPVTWYVVLSDSPALIGVSIIPSCYTHRLVRETGEFVLGIPDETMLKEIHFCGVHTGRDVDKIRHLNMSTSRARDVSALLLSECIGHLECRVREMLYTGDRRFYISEIVSLFVQPFAWQEGWTNEVRLVHYVEGLQYRIGTEIVTVEGVEPGYIPPIRI
ncbi:MAG: flavin reductase family protein [bacterium]